MARGLHGGDPLLACPWGEKSRAMSDPAIAGQGWSGDTVSHARSPRARRTLVAGATAADIGSLLSAGHPGFGALLSIPCRQAARERRASPAAGSQPGDTPPSPPQHWERPVARAVLMEGAGLAALRPRGACCQLAAKAAPSGSVCGSRVRVGASRGCSVGEPGPLRAAARMHRAPEGVSASGSEVGRELAMVHANGGGLRAVTVTVG